MSTYSKRIKIQSNVLIEYVFDDNNFKSEDFNVLTNVKEHSKSFLSTANINNYDNSLFLIDEVLSKYSKMDIQNFNYLRKTKYFTAPVPYDKVKIYFPSGFDFYDDYLGFYINIYTNGYSSDTKYSFSNFHYLKSNTNAITLFELPVPFYYDEKFWVRSFELDIPSVNTISSQRLITNTSNTVIPNSINQNLTYGEGISSTTPIFIDFAFITAIQTTLDIPYYYTGDLYSASLPQTPEFTELGINVSESINGDYFEIYATYLGSNENMDEFAAEENAKGNDIQLEYVVNLYEENILTITQTYIVTDNFTKKMLYRPVIQFSNTTAVIDVELKIVNVIDGSYISKFGSLGITNSINKYGLRLSQINMNEGVLNPEIFNLKIKNTMSVTGHIDSIIDVMKVPYPIMVDKYRILTKSTNASPGTNDYVPNGILEILITSFDNVINFNIAKDINAKGEPIPYDLSEINTNSKILLVFKSDSEKLEKEIFYEANNNYEIGNIYYKLQEKDYNILKRIYNKGYNNFYLIVSASGINTQLYSGKFVFYEDVTFVDKSTITTGTTSDSSSTGGEEVINTEGIDSVNPNDKTNMDTYYEDKSVDKGYYNAIVYIKTTTGKFKPMATEYFTDNELKVKLSHNDNMYFIERIYIKDLNELQNQYFVDTIYRLVLGLGQVSKRVKKVDKKKIYKNTKYTRQNPSGNINDKLSEINKKRKNN